MEYDVVIVGGGPSGLTTAIKLKQLNSNLNICVLEKASEIGAHILSGNVFETRALDELIPNWKDLNPPIKTKVTKEKFLFLGKTKSLSWPTWLLPAVQKNHKNYIISLANLCRWLAEQAETLGVEIFPGFPASEILFNDDGTLLRLSETGFRWICGDEYGGEWLKEIAKKKNFKVNVKNSTDQISNVSIQGPKSREILKKMIFTPPTQPSIDELEWFRFTICRIENLQGIPLIVSRTGYTGELGYEVWCHPSHASDVWDKLMEAGKNEGLIPAGFAALDKLRIEAGLILFGNEFDGQQDPFEAGIGFAVPLKTKDEDFIGKEVLKERKANPQKKLVGLELIGKEAAGHGDCVHVGRSQVGVITSGCLSTTLNKNIALCRIDFQYSSEGTEVEVGKIDGHQKRIAAKVVGFPHFDPKKTRVRS